MTHSNTHNSLDIKTNENNLQILNTEQEEKFHNCKIKKNELLKYILQQIKYFNGVCKIKNLESYFTKGSIETFPKCMNKLIKRFYKCNDYGNLKLSDFDNSCEYYDLKNLNETNDIDCTYHLYTLKNTNECLYNDLYKTVHPYSVHCGEFNIEHSINDYCNGSISNDKLFCISDMLGDICKEEYDCLSLIDQMNVFKCDERKINNIEFILRKTLNLIPTINSYSDNEHKFFFNKRMCDHSIKKPYICKYITREKLTKEEEQKKLIQLYEKILEQNRLHNKERYHKLKKQYYGKNRTVRSIQNEDFKLPFYDDYIKSLHLTKPSLSQNYLSSSSDSSSIINSFSNNLLISSISLILVLLIVTFLKKNKLLASSIILGFFILFLIFN